jgi:hypothetical protein
MVLQLLWEQRPGEGEEEEGRQEEGAAAEVQLLNSEEGAVPVQKEGVGPWVQLREQEQEQGQEQEQKQWHFAHDGEGQKLELLQLQIQIAREEQEQARSPFLAVHRLRRGQTTLYEPALKAFCNRVQI